MAYVSIYTVGRLNHPLDHPASREFFEVGKSSISPGNQIRPYGRGIFTGGNCVP